jgi:hypothetical protein
MIAALILFVVSQAAEAPAATDVEGDVKKDIIYKKETTVDLSGSMVEAENQVPPAFFLSKMQTPKAKGLLSERLQFSLRNYNDLGF